MNDKQTRRTHSCKKWMRMRMMARGLLHRSGAGLAGFVRFVFMFSSPPVVCPLRLALREVFSCAAIRFRKPCLPLGIKPDERLS